MMRWSLFLCVYEELVIQYDSRPSMAEWLKDSTVTCFSSGSAGLLSFLHRGGGVGSPGDAPVWVPGSQESWILSTWSEEDGLLCFSLWWHFPPTVRSQEPSLNSC